MLGDRPCLIDVTPLYFLTPPLKLDLANSCSLNIPSINLKTKVLQFDELAGAKCIKSHEIGPLKVASEGCVFSAGVTSSFVRMDELELIGVPAEEQRLPPISSVLVEKLVLKSSENPSPL